MVNTRRFSVTVPHTSCCCAEPQSRFAGPTRYQGAYSHVRFLYVSSFCPRSTDNDFQVTSTMASVQNSFHTYAHSILSAVQTFAADALSRCTAYGHAIQNAWIGITHLPSRLGNYITAVFHAMVNRICMILWKIGRVMLILVATCVALLVLKLALRKAYRRWWRSSQPQWRVHDHRSGFPRSQQRRFESLTSDWHWYGSVGQIFQQQEKARSQRASRQPRDHQNDADRTARDEQVKKQQAERKAAQEAQERRHNEEQEQRRAETRRKLSRDESERIYQRWKSSCDAAFKNPKLDIPKPPSFGSHVRDCKPVGNLHACTCGIARLLSAGSGPGNEFSERQKLERNRWHPDRRHFTSRRGGGPEWAQELHIAIKNAEVC